MIERRPDEAAAFRAGLEEIESSLRALDIRLAAALRVLAGQPVLFSHPVYQYLARRYALKGRSLHWEPGVLPDPGQWRELEAMLESHPARWMLYEGAPHPDTVSRLARLGVRVIVFAPGANRSPNRDWLTLMNENASRLEAALRNEPVGAGPGG
jgi:zinc transport system substrate-binding protein